jgi:hypothetical protein
MPAVARLQRSKCDDVITQAVVAVHQHNRVSSVQYHGGCAVARAAVEVGVCE